MTSTILKLIIPAGKATPSPPIGPALGQKGVKAHEFCKAFNDQSKNFIQGIPLRCFITINADKTFSFVVRPPSTSFLLKRAASIEKASTERIVARVSAKVLYELARVKHTDPLMRHMSLKRVYSMMLASARSYGFKIS